jgi:hypothetical protein
VDAAGAPVSGIWTVPVNVMDSASTMVSASIKIAFDNGLGSSSSNVVAPAPPAAVPA